MIKFGDMIDSYRVIGLSDMKVLAQSENAPDPYVVWSLNNDKRGVHSGSYRKNIESALKALFHE